MSLWFGLDSYLLQESCPNQPPIQTRFTSISPTLSESASYSASLCINFVYPV
jgi:hypothetical protein